VEFFPPELHAAMGVNNSKRKTLDISRFTAELQDTSDPKKDRESLLALDLGQNEDEKTDAKDKSDNSDEDDDEDEFDDDEDDDYNAEKYFNDGDDYGGDDSGDDGEAAY
jgi:DNA-directed RNA polymerase III subunit RPC7